MNRISRDFAMTQSSLYLNEMYMWIHSPEKWMLPPGAARRPNFGVMAIQFPGYVYEFTQSGGQATHFRDKNGGHVPIFRRTTNSGGARFHS